MDNEKKKLDRWFAGLLFSLVITAAIVGSAGVLGWLHHDLLSNVLAIAIGGAVGFLVSRFVIK